MSLKTQNGQQQCSSNSVGLRLAAADPHLVSLGGKRLSTAVTIHHLPFGDSTIGTSTECSIQLNGANVLAIHCTINRNEQGEVSVVAHNGAHLLIDGEHVDGITTLSQGSMLTIGKSNYLRFYTPPDAQNTNAAYSDRISITNAEFETNVLVSKNGTLTNDHKESQFSHNNLNSLPKDGRASRLTSITSKFVSYTKNLTENMLKSNNKGVPIKLNNSLNMPHANDNGLTRVKNDLGRSSNERHSSPNKLQAPSACYDRYPKPGSYGGLQVVSLNKINSEMNGIASPDMNIVAESPNMQRKPPKDDQLDLEELLEMCAEYEKQNQAHQVSPMVQNRIKTNGSLPRDKKLHPLESPSSYSNANVFFDSPSFKSGYENVKINPNGVVEIGGGTTNGRNCNGYENVTIVKPQVPQSPRTKIKTYVSPKIEAPDNHRRQEYEALAQLFEEKFRMDKEQGVKTQERISSTRKAGSNQSRCENKTLSNLRETRKMILRRIRDLKMQIADVHRQEDEVARNLDMEKALVSAEVTSELACLQEMQNELLFLQNKIRDMEGKRNLERERQETQQFKLKQSISSIQSKVKKLRETTKLNESEKADLNSFEESLENDRKHFEDLEFQYLEDETEWQAHKDELTNEYKSLRNQIDEKQTKISHLKMERAENYQNACSNTKQLEHSRISLTTELEQNREHLKAVDMQIHNGNGQESETILSDTDDEGNFRDKKLLSSSLFGSQELLQQKKTASIDIMSKSMNENMFFNNKIECLPPKQSSSSAQMFAIADSNSPPIEQNEKSSILKLKYNLSPPFDHCRLANECNLSLESDDFEVNPLERRVPSQDDIDRICKVTLDAPISTLGASDKVIESIREIERNRQLLLAQQGSHVIEHERQKMNELKKKSHEEARAQYLQLQSMSSENLSINSKAEALEDTYEHNKSDDTSKSPPTQDINNPPSEELSQNDFDQQWQRPVSETNSDYSFNAPSDKGFVSSSPDIRNSQSDNNRDAGDGSGNNRDSGASQGEMSDCSAGEKLVAGNKRNLPKHQRPLTRYLPIMSSNLDLRQHIETAGHQITLCPHVIVDETSCRGYLHKLGATFHGWAKRWFVLDRQKRALIYYADKSEKKPRGGAYFSTIDEVYLDHLNTSKSGRPHSTFVIKTKKRIYHLQAASDAATRIWIDAIITGAQGNIDY